RTERKKIIVIAAYAARWTAEAKNFQARQLRDVARKKLRLNFLRDGDFVFQTLLFFLFEHQILDGFGHRVERSGQRSQLVVGCDRNAMAEIATIDVGGGKIQLGNCASDRAL